MASVIQSNFAPAEVTQTGASDVCQSVADRVLAFAAMGGAVSGAIVGSSVAGDSYGFLAVLCGTLGTMLGSGIATGGCCLLARLWHPRTGRDGATE
jgi:hypothetical protein